MTTEITPFKPEQRDFCSSKKRYVGYVSGVGAGKTYGGIVRTIRNMVEWNPGEMGAIVAPSRQMIVNVIIPEMRNIGLFDAPANWEYKSAYSDEPGIHAPNGSRALMLSADNERTIERLRGLNLAWAWIDEEAVVDPRAREIIQQRLRTGSYRNLYITTTPKGKNHTYDFFVGDVDADKSECGEGVKYESEDRVVIAGVPTGRNPHTPEDYKEAMETDMPDAIRAQEVQGEFVEIGAGVFTTDMITFASQDELYDRSYRYVVGVDVGVESDSIKAEQNDTDYWAASLLMVDTMNPQAYLVDTLRKRGMSLNQGVNWMQNIVSGVGDHVEVYVESVAAQQWFTDALSDAGINAYAVTPSTKKEDRLIQLSIPIERGQIKFLNREIDEQLGYDPRFKELISEMLSFPEGSHDDLLDSLEIAVDNVDLGGYNNIIGADPYGRDE